GDGSLSSVLQTALTISFIRFVGATFLHALCSATIGYFAFVAYGRMKYRGFVLAAGIALATALHGLYNFSIITLKAPFGTIIPFVILTVLAFVVTYAFDRIKKAKSLCQL